MDRQLAWMLRGASEAAMKSMMDERLVGSTREELLLLATALALDAQRQSERHRVPWVVTPKLDELGQVTGLSIDRLWVS